MTHELHLGTADSSRNKGLALTANDQEESESDEEEAAMLVRKFKKFFRNSRYNNQRNFKERGTANSKANFECHKCGSTDHFIKECPQWKNEKGKGKARETGRQPMKGNFNKADFRKAMIAAWGESESEAETEVPVEEETANLCLMATHDEKSKEVLSSNSFPNYLFKLDKHELIKMILETQNNLEKQTAICLQIEKDLKTSKDQISYLSSFRSDV